MRRVLVKKKKKKCNMDSVVRVLQALGLSKGKVLELDNVRTKSEL